MPSNDATYPLLCSEALGWMESVKRTSFREKASAFPWHRPGLWTTVKLNSWRLKNHLDILLLLSLFWAIHCSAAWSVINTNFLPSKWYLSVSSAHLIARHFFSIVAFDVFHAWPVSYWCRVHDVPHLCVFEKGLHLDSPQKASVCTKNYFEKSGAYQALSIS